MAGAIPILALLATSSLLAQMPAGMKALDEQRYADAVEAFRKAVEAEPKDYAAHFHLALSLSLVSKDEDALAEYRTTLELKPGLYEAELNAGMLELRQKRPAKAVPYLESAAKQKPDQFRPVFYLAEALLGGGHAAQAETHYAMASSLDPKSAAAQAGWGRALLAQDKLADAAAHLKEAARLDPAYSDGLLELASQHERRKQFAEAIALYGEFPDNPAAQERMGNLLLESGQPERAAAVLEPVVTKSPTAANRYALATAYLRSKQPEKALAAIRQAVEAEPKDAALRLILGRLLRDQKKYAEAAQEFYRAVQGRPEDKEAWGELAGVLILMEQYPQALAALDKVQALGGETAGVFYLRAIVLDKNKLYKPALVAYRRFLELSKDRNPDEEFKARQRVRVIEKELSKR